MLWPIYFVFGIQNRFKVILAALLIGLYTGHRFMSKLYGVQVLNSPSMYFGLIVYDDLGHVTGVGWLFGLAWASYDALSYIAAAWLAMSIVSSKFSAKA